LCDREIFVTFYVNNTLNDRCCVEIKEIRSSLLTEGAHDRSLLAALLSTWKQLRGQRTAQGFTSCPLRLAISQHETNEELETQQWQKEVDTMVQEMLQEQVNIDLFFTLKIYTFF
jgi:hypothetical protein